jgi:hypothetical protein
MECPSALDHQLVGVVFEEALRLSFSKSPSVKEVPADPATLLRLCGREQ